MADRRGGGAGRRGRAVHAVLAALLVALAVTAVLPVEGERTSGAAVVIPPAEEILVDLRAGHPRIQLTPDDVVAVRARIATDPTVAAWYAAVRQRAHDLIGVAPVVYARPDGLRLLEVSREALRRLQVLGLVYLIDGEPEIAARGWAELEAITGFTNWNPVHFLDTAEMTHAAAIGLDWLHDGLTPEQRTTVVDAIRTKGLIPARDAYDGTAPPLFSWWTKVDHNWNQVTNGGIAIGALAVGDVDPVLAGTVLHEALDRLPEALVRYAPDGGWPEGVSYWLYATEYTVYALASLDTALGGDFGLSDLPGIDHAGDMPLHQSGPSGERWNWADDGEPRYAPDAPSLLWLAERYARPDWHTYQVAHAMPDALDVVWYRSPSGTAPPTALDHRFTGIDVATLRGPRDDPDAVYVGVKGGRPQENHNQLDVGSFVLEAEGVRWAMDLGRDDYNLPGYFANQIGGRRWTYYRNRAEGHNTLVLDPGSSAEDQDVKADAPIARFESTDALAFAIVDLASAYRRRPVQRGVRLEDRSRVVIQDELDLPAPADLWWSWHTRADIELLGDGRVAILRRDGKAIRVRLLGPADATFEVRAPEPLPGSPDPDGQATNAGVQVLAIHLPAVTQATIAVVVEPDETAPAGDVAVTPLRDWTTAPPATTSTTTTTSSSSTSSSTATSSTSSTSSTVDPSTSSTTASGGVGAGASTSTTDTDTAPPTASTTTATSAGPRPTAAALPAVAVAAQPRLTG